MALDKPELEPCIYINSKDHESHFWISSITVGRYGSGQGESHTQPKKCRQNICQRNQAVN